MPLLTLLIERFESQQPSVNVNVHVGNAFWGVEQVVDAQVDLGAVSITPPDQLWTAPIAIDAIAVIVHPENPLADLTLAQVREILSGRTWQWSDLGIEVDENEIVVVSREQSSGTRMAFEALAMTGHLFSGRDCQPALTLQSRDGSALEARLCEGEPVTSMAVLVLDSAAIVDFVATHPGAIGYVAHGHAGSHVKAVHIEGIPPTPEHVADGSYPLSQPFFLVAPQEPTGVARQFLDFCLSTEGQKIFAGQYVPVRSE
jgi:phosphate transport system substrate-binding protein